MRSLNGNTMYILNGHSVTFAGITLTIRRDESAKLVWIEQSEECDNGNTEAIKIARKLLAERAMRNLGLGWTLCQPVSSKVLRIREGSGF